MIYMVFFAYLIYAGLKIYISMQEIEFVKKARLKKEVILDKEGFLKAADYKIQTQKFDIISSFYEVLVFAFWIFFGLKYLQSFYTDESILNVVVAVDIFLVIGMLLSLPFDVYSTFVKDKKYGFSTIDKKTYIIDQVKSLVLSVVFGSLVIAIVSYIILNFTLWWFWSFILIFVIIIFINALYPTIIAPLFNKFKPLDDESLKESIVGLLKKAGLYSSGVFVVDASKRDNRLNAYFGGLGKSKRVVLYDTLIEKLSKNELLAVLGHELGHFKHKDILKNIAFMGSMIFVMFFIFGNLPQSLYHALGIKEGAFGLICMFLLLSPILSFIFMPLFGLLSRHAEYRADEYGSECQSKEALSSALMKLATENKSFPFSHKIFIAFYHTHPPLTKRLEALGVKFD